MHELKRRRLIILPKKTWHVWNQDNRERVLRDERLHREEEAKQAEKQRDVARQDRLEMLRARKRQRDEGEDADVSHLGATSASEMGGVCVGALALGASRGLDNEGLCIPAAKSGYVEGANHQGHVHLFGQVAEHLAKQAGNKDYARERAAQELRKKRAEGVAPWGFDDVKPARQWYEQGERAGQGQGPRDPSAPDEGGKQGEGGRDEKAERRRRRSERDRLSADPVSAFLKTPGSARAQPSPGARPSRFSPSYQSLRMAVTAGKQEGRGAKPDVDKVSFPSASLSSSSLSSGDERKASGRGEAGGREKRQVRGEKESAAKDRKSKKAWKEKKREKKKKEKRSSKEEKRQPENCGVKEKKDSRLARSRGDDGPQVSGQASSTPSSSSELHLLRQRRLEREREEHCKAVQLLAARQRAGLSYPTAASPWLDQPDVEMDDRKREYNSRFHLR